MDETIALSPTLDPGPYHNVPRLAGLLLAAFWVGSTAMTEDCLATDSVLWMPLGVMGCAWGPTGLSAREPEGTLYPGSTRWQDGLRCLGTDDRGLGDGIARISSGNLSRGT